MRARRFLHVLIIIGVLSVLTCYVSVWRTNNAAHESPVKQHMAPFSIACSGVQFMAKKYNWRHVTVSERNISRFKFWVYNSSDIVSNAVSSGTWEQAEIRELEWAMNQCKMNMTSEYHDETRTGPLFVDVGANIGWFALIMAMRGYQVTGFEGMLGNARMIAASRCLNPKFSDRMTLYHTGLGARVDTCWIYSGNTNVGDGHTMCGVATLAEVSSRIPANYQVRGMMRISRLDDILLPRLSPEAQPPMVLKIDVEGYEFEVLRGAARLLSVGAFHYVLAEWSIPMMNAASGAHSPKDFMYLMTGYGYMISGVSFRGPYATPERIWKARATAVSRPLSVYMMHRHAAVAPPPSPMHNNATRSASLRQ